MNARKIIQNIMQGSLLIYNAHQSSAISIVKSHIGQVCNLHGLERQCTFILYRKTE